MSIKRKALNNPENVKYEIELEDNPVAVAMMLHNRINDIINTYDSYSSWLQKWGIKDRSHQKERDELHLLLNNFNSDLDNLNAKGMDTSQLYKSFLNEASNTLKSIFHNWVESLNPDPSKRSHEVNNAANSENKHHMARMVSYTLVGLDANSHIVQFALPKTELAYAKRFQAVMSPKIIKEYELHGFKFSTAEKQQADPELKNEDSMRSRL